MSPKMTWRSLKWVWRPFSSMKRICFSCPVSELQVEMDNLMLHLLYTQGVSEDLRSNVKALMNVRSKASAEKNQAEDKKLQQVKKTSDVDRGV